MCRYNGSNIGPSIDYNLVRFDQPKRNRNFITSRLDRVSNRGQLVPTSQFVTSLSLPGTIRKHPTQNKLQWKRFLYFSSSPQKRPLLSSPSWKETIATARRQMTMRKLGDKVREPVPLLRQLRRTTGNLVIRWSSIILFRSFSEEPASSINKKKKK